MTPRPAARQEKPKAVKAWCVLSKPGGAIYALWTFDEKHNLEAFRHPGFPDGYKFNPKHDRWVQVEIRPLVTRPAARKRRKAK